MRTAALAFGLVVALTACSGPSPAPASGTSTPSVATRTTSPTRSPSAAPTPSPTLATTPATPKPTSRPAPGPMIVIDPGHSGRYRRSVDPTTGLRDIDYPNYPEIYEMFDAGSCLAAGLRLDGYRVRLTKKRALDTVGLAARAAVANKADAALAVSLHNDHGQGPDFQATYDQRGLPDGAGRYHPMYRGSGSHRTVYDHPAIARTSQRYAKIIAAARSAAQGRKVTVRENTFTGRAPLEPGNLAIVQLLSQVPWVYNEMGAKTAGNVRTALTIDAELGYTRGILVGVERAVPLAAGVVDQPSRGATSLRSCLVDAAADRPAAYRSSRGR